MRSFRSPLVWISSVIASTGHAQHLVRAVNGPAAGANFGKAVLRVGDQNHDGYEDVLVGAPGFNSSRGAIYCVSGARLATGLGAPTLWSVAPSVNTGDQFGYSLALISDVTNDGVRDFLIGEPGYDFGANTDSGAVRMVDGSTHAVVSLRYESSAGVRLGSALATIGDSTGDGKSEVAAGEPAPVTMNSGLVILDGAGLLGTGTIVGLGGFGGTSGNLNTGVSLASGFDLDGDGFQEFAFGMPGWTGASGAAANAGAIAVGTRTAAGNISVAFYESSIAGERLGESVSAANDYDGDGVIDIVVGAPKSPGPMNTQLGRVVVLSGAKLVAHTPPYEIEVLSPSSSATTPVSMHFGAAVCASRDLNNDGVGDILVGAPDYSTTGVAGKGAVWAYSGATGEELGFFGGAANDHIGDALAGAIDDLDGDGFREFVVGGSTSDAGGADSGVLKCYRLFPCTPSTYCTGKLNSLGCTPAIIFSGSPSVSSSAPFLVIASDFLNHKNGLLFYSHRPLDAPFEGGIKCVHNPTVRTPPQSSGGSASGSDCTGRYNVDFNAWIASGGDATLVAGTEVFAQYWSRDPASASHTGLSNAIRFVINP